jgi:small subunit ribosomal protein S16
VATTIRLTRTGRKQAPAYRLVVIDSRERRDGAYIDNLGVYNPMPTEYQCEIDSTRAIDWLDKGATMSSTARSLLRNEGILHRWHLSKQGLDDGAIDTAVEEFRKRRLAEREKRATKRSEASAAKLKAEADAAKAKAKEEAAVAKAKAEEESAAAAAAAAPEVEEAPAEEASAVPAEATKVEEPADEAPETKEPEA